MMWVFFFYGGRLIHRKYSLNLIRKQAHLKCQNCKKRFKNKLFEGSILYSTYKSGYSSYIK